MLISESNSWIWKTIEVTELDPLSMFLIRFGFGMLEKESNYIVKWFSM